MAFGWDDLGEDVKEEGKIWRILNSEIIWLGKMMNLVWPKVYSQLKLTIFLCSRIGEKMRDGERLRWEFSHLPFFPPH